MFVKLPGAANAGGGEIEIVSYSFGDTSSAVKLERVYVKSWSTSGAGAPPRPGGGNNQIRMEDMAGKETASRLPGKRTPPTVTLKRGMTRSSAGDPDRPVIAGTVPNPSSASVGSNETLTVGGGRTETATGQATGKRQHLPLRARAYYDQPLAKGSVWIRVSTPWAGCRVGARYPSLELGGGAKRYVLEDVTVASCGGTRAADDRPTEEVAFTYNKVGVRGWDPKKKEE